MTIIKTTLLALFTLLIIGMTGVSAQTTYYQDSFSRTGELMGSAPDVANTGGNRWTVSTGVGTYSINGSAIYDHNIAYDAAFLPVNGSSGVTLDGTKNFTLSATVTPDTTGQWYGIALNASAIAGGGNISTNNLAMVILGNGYAGAFSGNTSLTYGYNGYTAGNSYTIALFYSASAGTITYTAGGSVVYTLTGITAAQVAALQAVSLGNGDSSSTATADNFTLTVATSGSGSAPSAPTNLTATGGTAQISLSWTASTGATSYNVYRGTTAGGEGATAIATGITSASYVNTGLSNSTTYFYKVTASNAYGTSGNSNEATAMTAAGGGANLFGNGTYRIVSQSSTLSMSVNGTTNGSAVSQQTYTGAGTQQWNLNNLGGNVVTLMVPGTSEALEVPGSSKTDGADLDVSAYTGGTNQQWTIVSVGGGYYEVVNVNSGYEANVAYNSTTPGGLICQWDVGNYSNGVWAITSVSGGTTTYSLTVNSGSGSGSYAAGTVVNVTANTPQSGYQFAVWTGSTSALANPAVASTTLTMPASAASITATYTLSATAPSAPTGLTATAGTSQVGLSWSATSGATSYSIYRGTSAGGESTTAIATGITATSYTDSSVTNGTTYYYKITAVNSVGASSYSNEASATPTSGGSGGTTTYYQDGFGRTGEVVGTVPDTKNTNSASWSCTVGTGAYSANGSTVSISPSAYAYNAVFLPVNGTSGVVLDGTKDFTLSVVITPGSTGMTGIALSTGLTSNSYASLGTNALAALETGSGYLGAYSYNGGDTNYNFGTGIIGATTVSLSYSASAGTLTYTIGSSVLATQTGVTASQIAALRDVAFGDQGYGSGSATPAPTFDNFTLTVGSGGGSGGSAPAAPTNLSATAGASQVSLSWTASSGATSYNVYRGTTAGGESATAIATGITATSYVNTGLSNGTTYYYKVTAVNSYGTSSYSSEVSATPTSGAPLAPTNLVATGGSAQVSLNWAASTGATSYSVYRGTSAGGESSTAIASGIGSTSYTDSSVTNGTTYYYKVTAVNTSGASGYSNESSATPSGGGTANLILAVGLERIVSGYNGPAIRIQRPSDNAQQDIGFASGSNALDTAAVTAFLGQNQGWITILYSQDGSGHNVTAPSSTDNAPTISVAAPTGITINGASNLTARNVTLPYGPNGEGNNRYFVLPSSVSVNKAQMSAFLAFRPDYSGGPFMSLYEVGNPTTDSVDLMSCSSGFQGLMHNGVVTFANNNVVSRTQPTVVGLVTTPGSAPMLYLDGVGRASAGSAPASTTCSGGYLMAGTGTGLYYGIPLFAQYNFLAFALYNGTVNSSTAASISSSMLPRGTIPSVNIAADGDSITQGTGSLYGWDTLRYVEPLLNKPVDLTNIAVYGTPSGSALTHITYPTPATSAIGMLYNSSYSKNIYYLSIGTNDIHGMGATGAATWATVQQTLQDAKAMGFKTVVGTILHEYNNETATMSAEVNNFNALARAAVGQPYLDAIVDYAADSRLGIATNFYPAYSDDGTHPNDAGYRVMSTIATPVLNNLIGQ